MMDLIKTLLLPHLLEVVGTLLSLLIANVALTAKSRWNLEIEQKHRDALHSAVMTGLRSALQSGFTHERAVEAAVRYTQTSVPDAIGALRPDHSILKDLALSKLGGLLKSY